MPNQLVKSSTKQLSSNTYENVSKYVDIHSFVDGY